MKELCFDGIKRLTQDLSGVRNQNQGLRLQGLSHPSRIGQPRGHECMCDLEKAVPTWAAGRTATNGT